MFHFAATRVCATRTWRRCTPEIGICWEPTTTGTALPFTPPLLTATVLLREHEAGTGPGVQTDGPFLPFAWDTLQYIIVL